LLLAACTHDPYVNVTAANTTPSGEWRIERQTDRVTGAPISNALLMTYHVSNSNMVVAPPARLQLACFKEHAAVVIAFAFKIGSTRNAELAYRFDAKPGHEPRVRIVDDYRSVLIDDPNEVMRFTGDTATSDGLYLHIRSLTAAARTSAEFMVAGAPPAIAAAYAGCPLTPAAQARALPPARRDDKEDKEDKED
jgi:hypothetical protein